MNERTKLCAVVAVAVVSLSFCPTRPAEAQGILDTIKSAIQNGVAPVVRGRVALRDGQTLTCFEGIGAGYLGPSDLASPSGSSYDPRTGRTTYSTAAIPVAIVTRSGVAAPNNCDQLAEDGVLTLAEQPAAAGAAAKLPPKTACRDVPREMQSNYTLCISFDPEDHCSALPVDGTWKPGQTDLAAVCSSRKANAVIDEEQRYQARKNGQPAQPSRGGAGVASLQSPPAGVPGAESDEDLAWDGAKLCHLKPAQTLTLKSQALKFVRFDKRADRIVMSEMAGGARKEVALDESGFAQRSTAMTRDLATGGEACGRAFWGSEALKAATAAIGAGG